MQNSLPNSQLIEGSLRILGIDCGIAITGWAILELRLKSNKIAAPEIVEFGTIETSKHDTEPARLKELGVSVQEILAEFKPQEMAIEDLFFFKNAKTVIKVAQARGVVIYEAEKFPVQTFSYTPLQVKQTLTSYGRAKKNQVMSMLKTIFSLPDVRLQDDAADAVAIAYTHSIHREKYGLSAR